MAWRRAFLILVVVMSHGFEAIAGARPIGRLERLVYERHVSDLETGAERGLWFDQEAADRRIEFTLRHNVLPDLRWAGKPFVKQPWQEFCDRALFGWKRLPDGMTAKEAATIPLAKRRDHGIFRRYNVSYLEVARSNGKSVTSADTGLYCLTADGVKSPLVVSAATTRKQAAIVFGKARKMLLFGRPSLNRRATVQTHAIQCENATGVFHAVSSEAGGLQGEHPTCVLFDEVHVHPTSDLHDVLDTAQGAVDDALFYKTTTAGEANGGFGQQQHDYYRDVLEGLIEDDSAFVFIAAADPDDAIDDENAWWKANPNLGVTVTREALRKKLIQARTSAAAEATFRRYYMDQWVSAANAWLPLDRWDACADQWADGFLDGRDCYLGLDLSRTTDLTALALLFPPDRDRGDPHWRVIHRFWLPADAARTAEERGHAPYRNWERAGAITITPGRVVDYAYARAAIEEACARYNVLDLGYDPNNATHFINELESEGLCLMTETRQGYLTLSAPMKEIERLILTGALKHNANPVARWCFSNVVAKTDDKENIIPDKRKSTGRIDGVSALVTAMARGIQTEEDPMRVYESRGILSI